MKIGIISYNFYPLINPRAFRTFELVKEFANQGHEVTVFIPNNDFDYTVLISNYDSLKIEKIRPGFYLNKNAITYSVDTNKKPSRNGNQQIQKSSAVKKIKKKLIEWFYPGGFNFEFAFTVSKAIRKSKENFDLCISIGLPLNAHYGLRMAVWHKRSIARYKFADYGDPYSSNKTIRTPFFHLWFEKWILKKFDYIIVPTEKMLPSFKVFKPEKKLLVLPQGLDFSDLKLADQLLSAVTDIPVITYAGNFYKDIRNPEEFFNYLASRKTDFVFRIYTDINNTDNMCLIQPYIGLLGTKLEVNGLLPRNECIYQMSASDFLLNILNTTAEQTPSKLIDYKLSGRPTYSYRPGEFEPSILDDFFDENYANDASAKVKLDDFNIKYIVKKIVDLVKVD